MSNGSAPNQNAWMFILICNCIVEVAGPSARVQHRLRSFVPEDSYAAGPAKSTNDGLAQGGAAHSVFLDDNDGLPCYPMTRKPRGFCVIINNKNFVEGKDTRHGTDEDADLLTNLFREKLDFKVKRYDDLEDTQMITTMRKFEKEDHSAFDCLVVCILTHGDESNVSGVNGGSVSIKDITSHFEGKRCKTLLDKPKMFFFQACQGKERMGGLKQDGHAQHRIHRAKPNEYFIPNKADFLLGFAAFSGYVSFRDENEGSWYIRTLCEQIEKFYKTDDLLSILTEVNRRVARMDGNIDGTPVKQMPALYSSLTKKVQFF